MKKSQILYAITIDDVINVSKEEKIPFDEQDMPFIQDKIGDFIGDKWYDAVQYALQELKKENKQYGVD